MDLIDKLHNPGFALNCVELLRTKHKPFNDYRNTFERNLKIFEDRFTLGLTYKELGLRYDITLEAARKIVQDQLTWLKRKIKN